MLAGDGPERSKDFSPAQKPVPEWAQARDLTRRR